MPPERSSDPPADAVGRLTGVQADREHGLPGAHPAVFRLFQHAVPSLRQACGNPIDPFRGEARLPFDRLPIQEAHDVIKDAREDAR